MGTADSELVATAINSVERENKGWIVGDRLMDKSQSDTSAAYQRWKDAVLSAP